MAKWRSLELTTGQPAAHAEQGHLSASICAIWGGEFVCVTVTSKGRLSPILSRVLKFDANAINGVKSILAEFEIDPPKKRHILGWLQAADTTRSSAA